MSRIYQYTLNENGLLSEEQRAFYEENGYLMFRGIVNASLLDECQARFIDICNNKVDNGGMTIMKDQSLKTRSDVKGEFLINKIQDILYDDVLFKYACDEAIVKVVTSIVGSNITAVHSMLINKPPDASHIISKHPLHQDLHYFSFRPINRIVASWTAMERIDEANGCLFAIPGSHKGRLYPHAYPDEYDKVRNKAYHGVKGFDYIPKVNMVMEKGDTVFFHPLLLHGSGPNNTKGFRKAISVHFADTNSHFVDVRGTTQEDIAEEIELMSEKKTGGMRLKYEDIWKYKSRLVKGQPGNFQDISSHL